MNFSHFRGLLTCLHPCSEAFVFILPETIKDKMPYFIAYKPTRQTSNIYIESYKSREEAKNQYDQLRNTEKRGEIIIPPFFAWTEEIASEVATKIISD